MSTTGRAALAALVGAASLWAAVSAPAALACASCGSGGDDPLILYPNEKTKAYLGVARTSGFRNVDPDGALSTAGGPTIKEAVTASVGRCFTPRAFATVTLPYLRNVREDDERASMGDPSVAVRYTAVLPDLSAPSVPQVQLIAGYKHAQARSLRESDELKTLIDVFGTGFSEAKAGVDVWYGMAMVKGGVAHVVSKPLARSFDGVEYEPGLASRSTATVGVSWLPAWKTSVGVNRESRAALVADGEEQADSDQLNHGAFLTQDWQVSPQDAVRLAASRQAALGRNRNTSRASTVSLAFTRTL